MHYGDGTFELIKHHHAASWIEHYTAGRDYEAAYQAGDFLARIPERVPLKSETRTAAECPPKIPKD